MSKVVELRLTGLFPDPNDYTSPEGSMDGADNTVIDQENLQKSRRGFRTLFNAADNSLEGFPVRQMIATDQNSPTYDLLIYRYNEGSLDGRLLLNDEDTITGNNRFLPPTGAYTPRFAPWGAYIYVSSDEGILRYSRDLNSVVSAGIPQALDLELSLINSSGFLSPNESKSISALVTNASTQLAQISNDDISDVLIGQTVTGTGIPVGTTIQAITLSTPVVVYSAGLTAGSAVITVSASTGIALQQIVSGTGIPDNARVTNITGAGPYNITLSVAVITTDAAITVTFSSDNTITMSQAATAGPSVETVSISEGTQIAYRLVWGLRDENKAVKLGAPSGFTVIVNDTGESRDVQAIATIPAGITTDNFYQLYRSEGTPAVSITPADQMQLVVEGVPSPTDISNGYVTITDQTPDSLKGEALYTGSDQEGISQANYRPPTAVDICTFLGYTIYANYTQPQQLKLAIDGVGSPSGVQVGDLITITTFGDSFVLTAAAAEDIAAGEFEVFTTGTPAQNIADTANSFIRVLNRYTANTFVYAYLLSGPNDLPGQMLLEGRTGVLAFDVEASANGSAWTPDIDTAQLSEAENNPSGLLISKYQQPEAVPRVNLFPAGGIGNIVQRVVPLRDYVVVITSEGIYRLTGQQSISDFDVNPFDLTVQIVGPETAVALGNECWALSNQGAVSISDGGVRIRSGLQINDVLQRLVSRAPASTRSVSFGAAYESDQRYILSLPDSEGDTVCTQQFCYNYITNKWTRWTRNCTTGYVNKYNGLYLGNGDNDNLVIERKNGTFEDYVDEAIPVLITAFDGLEITLNTVTGVTVGDVLFQNQSGVSVYAEIVAIDVPGSMVTVNREITWDIGGAPEDTQVLTAIECVMQWKPQDVGDPTEAKQVSEGQIIFRANRFFSAQLDFATDISPGFDPVEIPGQSGGEWGIGEWGEFPWGGSLRPGTNRFYIPADKQYCGVIIIRLTIRSGLSDWQLEGVSLQVNDIGPELGGSDV